MQKPSSYWKRLPEEHCCVMLPLQVRLALHQRRAQETPRSWASQSKLSISICSRASNMTDKHTGACLATTNF